MTKERQTTPGSLQLSPKSNDKRRGQSHTGYPLATDSCVQVMEGKSNQLTATALVQRLQRGFHIGEMALCRTGCGDSLKTDLGEISGAENGSHGRLPAQYS